MGTRTMVTMWAMAMAMRLMGNKEGKGKGGKCKGNSNGRVTSKKEGKGSKAMALVTRMAGKWPARVTKRAMTMATRVAGNQQQWQQRGQGQW